MELQIQDLISSIRKEGIDAAQAESDAIIAAANKKAADIVAEANQKAALILADAEQKIATLKTGAQENARQARRDAVLSFKDEISKEYRKILSADVKKAVSGASLGTLIKAALAEENPADYAAEIAEVTEGLKGELASEIRSGLEIKVNPAVHAGFRLAAKDGSGYFDCTDEQIADMLKPFLSSMNI